MGNILLSFNTMLDAAILSICQSEEDNPLLNRPVFMFGISLFAGIFATGLKPWYLTYVLLSTVIFIFVSQLVVDIKSKTSQGISAKQNQRNSSLIAIVTTIISVGVLLFGYQYSVSVWKAHFGRYESFHKKSVYAQLRIKSAVENKNGKWNVEAEVLWLSTKRKAQDDDGSESGADKDDDIVNQNDTENAGGTDNKRSIDKNDVNGQQKLSDKPDAGKVLLVVEIPIDEFDADAVERQNKTSDVAENMHDVEAADVEVVNDDLTKVKDTLRYNQIIEVKGTLFKPEKQQNEFLFDYQKYLYSRGFSATIYVKASDIEEKGRRGPYFPIGTGIAVRECIEKIYLKFLPEREAEILTALSIGKKDNLDEQTKHDFQFAGLIHMMAVSGMHVIMLAGFITGFLKRTGVGIKRSRWIALVGVIGFVFITGFSESILRAAIMFTIDTIAKQSKASYDNYSAISLAAILILLFNPLAAFGAGFQLSFSATLAIFLLTKKITKRMAQWRIHKSIKSVLAASLAVQFGIFPIQTALFGTVYLYSIPANIVVSPFLSVVMLLGIILAVTGPVIAVIGAIPAFLVINFIMMIRGVAGWIAKLPFSVVAVPNLGLLFFICYYGILYFVFKNRRLFSGKDVSTEKPGCKLPDESMCDNTLPRRRFRMAPICLTVVIVFFFFSQRSFQKSGLEVVFLDVGNANAAYINVDGKYHILIDAGGKERFGKSEKINVHEKVEQDEVNENFEETRLYDYLSEIGRAHV